MPVLRHAFDRRGVVRIRVAFTAESNEVEERGEQNDDPERGVLKADVVWTAPGITSS
jgi:hypothetical protein